MKKLIRSNTALRRLYYRLKIFRGITAQSDEASIIAELARGVPLTFVEFGFHPMEFNCYSLARNPEWRGLLIDGNAVQVADAKSLLPKRVKIVERFLTLDNLDFVATSFEKIGVLSIDVDGNDYWFLERLIEAGPEVICIEYNASFGLAPITVPYDPDFDRHEKHPTGWYHGASLTALAKLASRCGYGLAAVSKAGANAFFTKSGKLDPESAWRPSAFRESFSGVDHDGQWNTIKHLPYVSV